jgi:hypothetical protein
MSEPEANDERGLEEILASIRKSLTEPAQTVETGNLEPGGRLASPLDAANRAGEEPSSEAAAAPSDVGERAEARDAQATRAASAEDPEPGSEPPRQDPLWFLRPSRAAVDAAPTPPQAAEDGKSTGEAEAGVESPAAGALTATPQGIARDVEAATPAAHGASTETAEDAHLAQEGDQPLDVKLTQPHVLRKSFPPLFGEAPPAPAPMPAAAQPDIPASAVAAFVERIKAPFFETRAAASEPRVSLAALTGIPPAPVGRELDTIAHAAGAAASEPSTHERRGARRNFMTWKTVRRASEEPLLGADLPSGPTAAEPPAAEASGVTPRTGEPGALPNGEAAPAVAPLPATPALEAIIAELLEPVLRQWLETRLPRLVEGAIREEVARQLRKSDAGDAAS